MNEDEFTGSQGCWTNMTNAIDQSLNSAFGKLGMFCAMNPVKVLVMGFVLTVGLGFGLAFHQITTEARLMKFDNYLVSSSTLLTNKVKEKERFLCQFQLPNQPPASQILSF